MLPTTTIIQRLCPGLFADPGLNDFISMAQDLTSSAWFGNFYNLAVALRASHDWTLATRRQNGAPGALVQAHEGQQSQMYSKGANQNPDDLEQTVFGVRLKTLRKSVNSTMGVATGLPQPKVPDMSWVVNWFNW